MLPMTNHPLNAPSPSPPPPLAFPPLRPLQDIVASSNSYELNSISLPIQRELVGILHAYVDILLEMFQLFVDEDRGRRNVEARKNSVEKLVEEFVWTEPVLTGIQKEWKVRGFVNGLAWQL